MVKKKKVLILSCIITAFLMVLAVGVGIFVYKNRNNSNIVNVFDEMIENGHTAMEDSEHVTAGGFDAIRMLWTVKEGTPLRIGIIYSMEYKKLYIYGDACMPEEIQDMSYQEYFEECLKEYGITWEEVEDRKEDFICKNILGTWFTEYESCFTKDKLGELEVLDFLMPYEYCGKDNSEWMTVTETIEEGYRGAFNGKVQYTVWDAVTAQCRQTQKSRDYGYHDIMERIEADINGFNTVSEDIKVEWDWKGIELDENEYTSLADIFDLGCYEFVDWLQAGGEVEGNLTKLAYTREEGEEKTREMLEQCSESKLFHNLEAADYYIAGNELNIRLVYYDYEAEDPDWMENGNGELWQGWITVKISSIRKFMRGDFYIFDKKEIEQGESEKKEIEQQYYFSVGPGQVKENLMGYTLMRTTEGVYYVEDSDRCSVNGWGR
ncbi:MAG: TipC family immunity protein [Lachnospiraceae bacterium]|nr:TipC family immunity protein [Lachnospiraceae bacterium]